MLCKYLYQLMFIGIVSTSIACQPPEEHQGNESSNTEKPTFDAEQKSLESKPGVATSDLSDTDADKVENPLSGIPNSQVSSHCDGSEEIYATGILNKIIDKPEGGYDKRPSSNVVSLCYQSLPKPQFAYRFGEIGNPGLEHIATIESPLHTYFRQIGKVSVSYYFFRKGQYTYFSTIAGGMGTGVGVKVYKNENLIAEWHSDFERGKDFESDFLELPSGLLVEKTPEIKPWKH